MDVVITILGCVLVFFLQSQASLCNARMDTVTNKLSSSIYRVLPMGWYDPVLSSRNKHEPAIWRTYAKAYLPKWIYYVINKYKPAYDPLSDFWHYEKMKMKLYELAAFLVGLVGIYLATTGLGICFALCFMGSRVEFDF